MAALLARGRATQLLRQIAAFTGPPAASAFHSLQTAAPACTPSLARAAARAEGLRSLALHPPATAAAAAGRRAAGLGLGLGLRHHSSVQQSAQQVQQAIKAAATAPAAAVRSAAAALTTARLPPAARRWVDAVNKPGALQRALSLQLEAAWQRHSRKVVVGGTVALAYLLFRGMRFSASAFVEVSQSLATTGLLALAATGAALGSLWFYRRRFVISPDAVYRAAMLRLNTHPGVLEVLGAPVAGSDVRASVVTGGGLKFKGLRPKLRARRVQMIFPLRGADRRGLVSLEAKKKRGALRVTLLAVDVPLPAALGGEQRVYVEGGPRTYSRGGVLDELRKPFLAALTSEEAAEAEEEAEDAAEERAHRLRAAAAEEAGGAAAAGEAPLKQGMYFYERLYFAVKRRLAGSTPPQPPPPPPHQLGGGAP
jgi:hypothetical protein